MGRLTHLFQLYKNVFIVVAMYLCFATPALTLTLILLFNQIGNFALNWFFMGLWITEIVVCFYFGCVFGAMREGHG